MGALDNMKAKAKDLANQHSDQVKEGLKKAGNIVNEKTGGKHSDKIDRGVDKAGEAVDKFAER